LFFSKKNGVKFVLGRVGVLAPTVANNE